MAYTELFTERASLLAVLSPVSVTNGAEAFTAYVSLLNYHRAIVKIQTGVMQAGSTIDAQVHQALNTAGGSPKHITGKAITQLTQAGGDSGKTVVIEVRSEELDVSGEFDCIALGYTVGTAASIMAIEIWGLEPRYAPVANALIDEVVD